MKFVFESYEEFVNEAKGAEDMVRSIFNLGEIEKNPKTAKENIEASFDDDATVRDLKVLVDQIAKVKDKKQKQKLVDLAVNVAKRK